MFLHLLMARNLYKTQVFRWLLFSVFCLIFSMFVRVVFEFFFRLIMIFFSVTHLSSGSGGQFINLDFKRLPSSHFTCLLIYTFLYWYTERFICFLIDKNLCYIVPSKLRLLEDSCKGMSFVSFSQSNVNKTYWLPRRARYSCLFFTVQIKAEITGGINTT